MKEVGHKLLKCPSDICRAANYDAGAKKVLENENIASFLVRVPYIVYLTKLSYDTCAYKNELAQSVGSLGWILDESRFHNNNNTLKSA